MYGCKVWGVEGRKEGEESLRGDDVFDGGRENITKKINQIKKKKDGKVTFKVCKVKYVYVCNLLVVGLANDDGRRICGSIAMTAD